MSGLRWAASTSRPVQPNVEHAVAIGLSVTRRRRRIWVVVNDEHGLAGFRVRFSSSAFDGGRFVRLRHTDHEESPTARAVFAACPPCASTKPFTMVSPNPPPVGAPGRGRIYQRCAAAIRRECRTAVGHAQAKGGIGQFPRRWRTGGCGWRRWGGDCRARAESAKNQANESGAAGRSSVTG